MRHKKKRAQQEKKGEQQKKKGDAHAHWSNTARSAC